MYYISSADSSLLIHVLVGCFSMNYLHCFGTQNLYQHTQVFNSLVGKHCATGEGVLIRSLEIVNLFYLSKSAMSDQN